MICEREKNLGNSFRMSKSSQGISLNLTPAARSFAERIRERTGVPATEALARLLEWFSSMPVKFQTAVLMGHREDQLELLVAWFKETMQASGKGVDVIEKDDVTARLRLAHQILNEIEMAYEGKKMLASELMAEKKKKKG